MITRNSLLLLALAQFSLAAQLTFVPPNDQTGAVWTTNFNDAWSSGRGIVFQATSGTTISSVGLFQNLTNIGLSYAIYETTGLGNDVRTGQSPLRSGGSTVSTLGLEWLDYGFAPLNLAAGGTYHIEFTFSGNSNQNFFYNNGNTPWTQGLYTLLDGTQGGSTSNYVVGAFRVDSDSVPEPSSIGMILGGIGIVALRLRRRPYLSLN